MAITIQQARVALAAALDYREEDLDLIIRRSKELGLLPPGPGGHVSPQIEAEHVTFLVFAALGAALPKQAPIAAIELAYTDNVGGATAWRPAGASNGHPLMMQPLDVGYPPDEEEDNRSRPLMQRPSAWRAVHLSIKRMRRGIEFPRLLRADFGYVAEQPFVNVTAQCEGPDLSTVVLIHARARQDPAVYAAAANRRCLSNTISHEAFAKIAALLGPIAEPDAPPSSPAVDLYRRMAEIAEERELLRGGESRVRRRAVTLASAAIEKGALGA
jgi:hypothetical protein